MINKGDVNKRGWEPPCFAQFSESDRIEQNDRNQQNKENIGTKQFKSEAKKGINHLRALQNIDISNLQEDSASSVDINSFSNNQAKVFNFYEILHRQKLLVQNHEPLFTHRSPVVAAHRQMGVLVNMTRTKTWTSKQIYTQLLIWNISGRIERLKSANMNKSSTHDLLILRILEKFLSIMMEGRCGIEFCCRPSDQLNPVIKNPLNENVSMQLSGFRIQRDSIKQDLRDGVKLLKSWEHYSKEKRVTRIPIRNIKRSRKELTATAISCDSQLKTLVILINRIDSRLIKELNENSVQDFIIKRLSNS